MTDKTLVFYGGEVKALGDGRVGGYLVLYGNPDTPDLHGEYFSKSTDFDIEDGDRATVYYQHGMDESIGKRALGRGRVKVDDVGVWVEAQLKLRDEYEKAIYELARAGKLGWSSGTASHLMERDVSGKGVHITRWPIVEASLTPTPAEPRTQAIPVKSLPTSQLIVVLNEEDADVALPEAKGMDSVSVSIPDVQIQIIDNEGQTEVYTMSEHETKADTPQATPQDDSLKALEDRFNQRIERLLDVIENSPRVAKSGYVSVDGGEADPQVKTLGDFFIAVRRNDRKRLASVYGSVKAQTEGTGTEGGYMVPEQFLGPIITDINMASGVVERVRRIPVASPSGSIPSLDFGTSVTAGSGDTAGAAGVGMNVRSEAAAYTVESATFQQINFRVFDQSGYIKASKELTEDAPAIEAILRQTMVSAIAAKKERDILRGTGIGEPLGILTWSGAVGITPDTNNAFAFADASEMRSRFKNIGGGQPVWIMHPGIIPDLDTFSTGSAVAWFSDMAGMPRQTLMGYPILFSEHLPQDDNSGCVILADLSAYACFERGAVYVDFSSDADFLNGNDVWRFGSRYDGKPLLNSAITLSDPQGSFTVSPFVYFND